MSEKVLTFLGRSDVLIGGSALAAFLVLIWVLRGAAPGRAVEGETDAGAAPDAPLAGRRERMVFGVAFGLLLIVVGALVAIDRGIPWSLPLFAGGFGIVLLLSRINRRYRHSSPILRRTIDVSGAFLDLSLLAGVLIVLNVLMFRYGGAPLDLTRERAYTLTNETIARVRGLNQPVTFTLVGGPPGADLRRARIDQLLESYRSINPGMIRITELNPYEDLARAEELSKRVPALPLLRGGGVIIEYGDDEKTAPVVIRSQDLFAAPSGHQTRGGDRFESAFTGEDAITSALDRFRAGKGVKVAFTTGHGELKPDDMGLRGLGNWRARLSRVGYDVSEQRLDQGELPDDLALLIVAGPTDPIPPAEAARLREFADKGKPILLLLGNEHPSGLEELLRSYNLEIGPGMILEPDYRSNYNGDVTVVIAPSGGGANHPISSAMSADRRVLLPHAAPIRILGQAAQPGSPASEAVNRDMVPTAILRTGRSSWAETDAKAQRPTYDAATETRAPVVGVAVARRRGQGRSAGATEEEPRLVLFSCPMMAENRSQEITPANLDLLMNAASWLRGSPADTLGISPQTHTALTLTVDPLLQSRLILVPTATSAMLIIAMGIIVYVSRRE